ncbi:MAG: VOC family protein [Actinomycetota bacterium]
MKIRLRQVALVAADLAAVERDIESSLGVELCFRDPGVGHFGLVNALYPIGDKLLEVVSPTQEGTTVGRLLDKRGGDGGYMVIFQVDDLGEMRRRLADADARVVFEAEAEGVTGLHIHPRDVGGAIVSVDETDDWGAWPWAGPTWQSSVRTDVVTDIAAVEIHAGDPEAMAHRWASVLGGTLEGTTLAFDEGSIRFTPAGERGEGVAGIDLVSAGSAGDLDLCGTAVRLVPSG